MDTKGQNLQDLFLMTLRQERVPVSMFMVNGIRLQGQIESFDQYVVMLRSTTVQLVYKHAISTVVPTHDIKGAWSGQADGDSRESSAQVPITKP